MAKLFDPEELSLSNGIPVVLQHYEGTAAAIYWWVKTGSADEQPREAGFAHFLEHMLFKDAAAKETGRVSTGKTARVIESLGGDINAYTSFDQTVYHVTCAAQHWERVIDAFGTMAAPQKFLKEDFQKEREVILEEVRKNEDSPERQLFQTLFSLTYRKHPYGKPVIGNTKSLKTAKVSDLEAFYRRNYVSEKMGIVLVGPLGEHGGARRKAIFKLLEKRFGKGVIPKREGKKANRIMEPELRKEPELKERHFDVQAPTLSFSLRVPHLTHEDIPALDLLAGILGMGEMSRLYQRLFYQTSLATEVSAGLYVPNDPGMLFFQAEVAEVEKIPLAAEEIFKEIHRLREEGPTPEEVSRVLVNAESERLYATQTADGLAGRLAFSKFVLGDLAFDEKYLAQLRSLDADQLKDVARRYFDARRLSAVVLLPKAKLEPIAAPILDRARSILGMSSGRLGTPPVRGHKQRSQAREEAGKPEEFKLPSGVTVLFLPREQSHVFSVYATVLGGLRLEAPHWGASHMLAGTWTKGTQLKDAQKISSLIEGHAAGMEGASGKNSIGLQLTGLSRDWGVLSEVFSEVLLEASFPESEVDHTRRVVEDSIRSLEDHSSQLCSKLFFETLFEKHPYGRLTIGTSESVRALQGEKLRELHRAWLQPERLVLAVSGAVKRAQLDVWLAELDQKFSGMRGDFGGASAAVQLEPEAALKAPRWVEKSLGREQIHILIGGLGTQVNAEDRHTIRLLQTILGGQSGRLFIELREKRSLAYAVAPLSFEGVEPGYIGTYIASAPGKREEAVLGIRKVYEDLVKKGPSKTEMERAKEYLMGRRAMDLQSDSALAAHHGLRALYGLPYRSDAEILKRILAIKPKEIQDVCRKYLLDAHQVTAVVG